MDVFIIQEMERETASQAGEPILIVVVQEQKHWVLPAKHRFNNAVCKKTGPQGSVFSMTTASLGLSV